MRANAIQLLYHSTVALSPIWFIELIPLSQVETPERVRGGREMGFAKSGGFRENNSGTTTCVHLKCVPTLFNSYTILPLHYLNFELYYFTNLSRGKRAFN